MAILNYTTQIDVSKTVGEVQAMLAHHGAARIMLEYKDREPSGITFEIEMETGWAMFALPVDVDAMHRLLVQQDRAGKLKSLSQAQRTSMEQAARVAWRIIKDWLEAQLAIIETRMVSMDQVMLPYLHTGKNRTVYDDFRDQRAITS